jgi:glycerol-3-phosphate dehydrogenase subunit B
MTYDVVVIGVGLAGLTAALRLAEQGQRVLVVAKGIGGTHLAPATIDVLGYVDGPVESPARALPQFAAAHPDHPYRRLSVEVIRSSLE